MFLLFPLSRKKCIVKAVDPTWTDDYSDSLLMFFSITCFRDVSCPLDSWVSEHKKFLFSFLLSLASRFHLSSLFYLFMSFPFWSMQLPLEATEVDLLFLKQRFLVHQSATGKNSEVYRNLSGSLSFTLSCHAEFLLHNFLSWNVSENPVFDDLDSSLISGTLLLFDLSCFSCLEITVVLALLFLLSLFSLCSQNTHIFWQTLLESE